jgi:signal peptidase
MILRRLTSLLAAVGIVILASASIIPAIAPQFGYSILTVRSGSMSPTVSTGALIAVHSLSPEEARNLKAGDIITFHRPGPRSELVTHRIYSLLGDPDKRSFATKGDANGIIDTWSVTPDMVVGKLSADVPVLGYIDAFLTTWPVRTGIIALLVLYGITTRPDEKLEKVTEPAVAA